MGKTNPLQTSWDLTPLFKSDKDPKMGEELENIQKGVQKFVSKWQKNEQFLSDPKVLKQALDEYEALMRNWGTTGKLGYYWWLKSQQDQNNSFIKAQLNKIEDFGKKLWNELQFFEHRLGKVRLEKQQEFLKHPDLLKYHHFLENIFKWSKYLLSEPEEKIITLKSGPAHDLWIRMTSSFLSKEERLVVLENGKKAYKPYPEIISLFSSQKKVVRNTAAKAFNDILVKHTDVAENELNAILADKKINDELRKMDRPDLARHLSDDINSEVVDSLLSAVSSRFTISHKFYHLKSKLLKLKKLQYHERIVEFGEVHKKYPFPKASQIVLKVLTGLDEKFGEIFSSFLEQKQIDVFPKKGKKGGAFCAYEMITHPTYMLLNYTNKIEDVLTLAHELGHGINFELTKEKQHALNFGTPLSVTEVASILMENFVLEDILQTADEQTKLTILIKKLDNYMSQVFRQIACYNFELELHRTFREKGYLSKIEIGKLFQKHMSSYMGPAVEQSPGSENWWVYWSHIRQFFYNYSYANGLLIALYMQKQLALNPEYISKIKDFLSAGLSDSPKNIFKNLGIDLTDKSFWQQGLDEIQNLLTQTEDLAKQLKKLKV